MSSLNDPTMALNSTRDTSARPTASFFTLPSEIRQLIYEHFFAPDLSVAQYTDQLDSIFWRGHMLGLRLGLLAVCKQIYAEAIDVLYKCSVFYFRIFVSGVRAPGYMSMHTQRTMPNSRDGHTMMTIMEPDRAGKRFGPIEVDFAPLFCYRPRPHIHLIQNIHLVHTMEGDICDYKDDSGAQQTFRIADTAIALYLTIFRDTCPNLETLTIEFGVDRDLRHCHKNRFSRTIPYLRETKTIDLSQNTAFLLEQLWPQLRQIRIVAIAHLGNHYIDALRELLWHRGAVHENIQWIENGSPMGITTLTQQKAQDCSQTMSSGKSKVLPPLTFSGT